MTKEFYMNYAEGQQAPTKKHNELEAAKTEAGRLAETLGVNVTILKAVTHIGPKDITKRVQSYEDACKVLGSEPINVEMLYKLGFTNEEIVRRVLETITKALNEGWEPNWGDKNEYKYYPYFYIETNDNGSSCGLSCAYSDGTASSTSASRFPALLQK